MAGCWTSRRRRSNGPWRPRPTRVWPACRSPASPSTRTRSRAFARPETLAVAVRLLGFSTAAADFLVAHPEEASAFADVTARSRPALDAELARGRRTARPARRAAQVPPPGDAAGRGAGPLVGAVRGGRGRDHRGGGGVSRRGDGRDRRRGPRGRRAREAGWGRAELRLGRRRRVRPRGERARTAGGRRARGRGPDPRARRPDRRGHRAPRRPDAPSGRRARRAVVVARRDARLLRDAGRDLGAPGADQGQARRGRTRARERVRGDAWPRSCSPRCSPSRRSTRSDASRSASRSTSAPRGKADVEVKRGRGGIRDVEFAVQLLQIVHGRRDERLREPNTLRALEVLADEGYVGRDDADAFGRRVPVPADARAPPADRARPPDPRAPRRPARPDRPGALARPARRGGARSPSSNARPRWSAQVHERLFYRPLLEAFAGPSTPRPGRDREATEELLGALGFDAPRGRVRGARAARRAVHAPGQGAGARVPRHGAGARARVRARCGADPARAGGRGDGR